MDVTLYLLDPIFFVKDNLTGRKLLTGKSEGRLYPIQINQQAINSLPTKIALLGVRTSSSVWHAKLGHTSSHITNHVLKSFKLPISGPFEIKYVCQFCLMGKAKQLPFGDSMRVVLSLLSLIHSDVWVSPVTSNEGYKYYVLFIDYYAQ